jgi:hypothetical protein
VPHWRIQGGSEEAEKRFAGAIWSLGEQVLLVQFVITISRTKTPLHGPIIAYQKRAPERGGLAQHCGSTKDTRYATTELAQGMPPQIMMTRPKRMADSRKKYINGIE